MKERTLLRHQLVLPVQMKGKKTLKNTQKRNQKKRILRERRQEIVGVPSEDTLISTDQVRTPGSADGFFRNEVQASSSLPTRLQEDVRGVPGIPAEILCLLATYCDVETVVMLVNAFVPHFPSKEEVLAGFKQDVCPSPTNKEWRSLRCGRILELETHAMRREGGVIEVEQSILEFRLGWSGDFMNQTSLISRALPHCNSCSDSLREYRTASHFVEALLETGMVSGGKEEKGNEWCVEVKIDQDSTTEDMLHFTHEWFENLDYRGDVTALLVKKYLLMDFIQKATPRTGSTIQFRFASMTRWFLDPYIPTAREVCIQFLVPGGHRMEIFFADQCGIEEPP